MNPQRLCEAARDVVDEGISLGAFGAGGGLLFPLGLFGFLEMAVFILVLLVGYVYAWKKGALDWNR